MWFLTDTLLNPPDQNRQNVRRKRKVCRLQPAFFGGHSHFLPLPAWPGCMHVRGGGRRAFKQSVSPSAVDGGRDAQLGRRWFEVSGEKERDPKNLAAWPFCLAWCACCSLFRSLILVRLHRQTRTHARHASSPVESSNFFYFFFGTQIHTRPRVTVQYLPCFSIVSAQLPPVLGRLNQVRARFWYFLSLNGGAEARCRTSRYTTSRRQPCVSAFWLCAARE